MDNKMDLTDLSANTPPPPPPEPEPEPVKEEKND
jgi:hypothetical protein